eukprot:c11471_g1_i1.p1 GENE.c11471_g1_i1~~c11471_g1_i1.p1  ORF type:complete len:692 (-),score=156.04 c11471_g1_i1:1103-3091(-)
MATVAASARRRQPAVAVPLARHARFDPDKPKAVVVGTNTAILAATVPRNSVITGAVDPVARKRSTKSAAGVVLTESQALELAQIAQQNQNLRCAKFDVEMQTPSQSWAEKYRLRIAPWVGRRWVYEGRTKRVCSWPERVHVTLRSSEATKCGRHWWTLMLATLIVAVISLILEGNEYTMEYRHGCEQCKPVDLSASTRAHGTYVLVADAERLTLADQCRDCEPLPSHAFFVIETVCMAIFTFDYLILLVTIPFVRSEEEISQGLRYTYPTHRTLRRLVRFQTHPRRVVDVLTLLPFYLSLAAGLQHGANDVFSRALGVVRVVRILKFARHSNKMLALLKVLISSGTTLKLMLIFALFGMSVCGTIAYYAEKGTWDPATGLYLRPSVVAGLGTVPTPFTSAHVSFYWTFITFTTVGYGDIVPTTTFGRVVAVCSMYFGILLTSLPITMVSGNFVNYMNEQDKIIARDLRVRQYFAIAVHIIQNYKRINIQRKAWNHWMEVVKELREQENNVAYVVRNEVKRMERHLMQVLGVAERPAIARAHTLSEGSMDGNVRQLAASSSRVVSVEDASNHASSSNTTNAEGQSCCDKCHLVASAVVRLETKMKRVKLLIGNKRATASNFKSEPGPVGPSDVRGILRRSSSDSFDDREQGMGMPELPTVVWD